MSANAMQVVVNFKKGLLDDLKRAAKMEKTEEDTTTNMVIADHCLKLVTESREIQMTQVVAHDEESDAEPLTLRVHPGIMAKWLQHAGNPEDGGVYVSATAEFGVRFVAGDDAYNHGLQYPLSEDPKSWHDDQKELPAPSRRRDWNEDERLATFLIPGKAAEQLLSQTIPYIDKDAGPVLGDNLELTVDETGIRAVSCDGYRMAIAMFGALSKDAQARVINKNVFQYLRKQSWNVSLYEYHVKFETPTITIRRMLEGTSSAFPNYNKVCRHIAQPTATMDFDGGPFAQGLKPLMAINKTPDIRFTGFKDHVEAHAYGDLEFNITTGKASRTFVAQNATGEPDQIRFCVDGKYIAQTASLIGKRRIRLEWTSATQPIRLHSEPVMHVKTYHVIMPKSMKKK